MALGLCLLASCYLEVGSSGTTQPRGDFDDEPAASSASALADAAVWERPQTAALDGGERAVAGEDAAAADAGAESGPAVLADAAVGPAPSDSTAFTLSSPAFPHAARLPDSHTCKGGDRSPPFAWTNPPDGVETFMLVLTATRVGRPSANVEWVISNIPAESRALTEGIAAGRAPSNAIGLHQEAPSEIERAALDLGLTGKIGPSPLVPAALAPVDLPSPFDLVRRPRYRGPCDEQGVSYEFTLYALDAGASLERDVFASLEAVAQWMTKGNGALGRASITATYP